MEKKTVINYHVKCPGLVDALRTACDVQQSCGMVPVSIDLGFNVVCFDYGDALAVLDGRMPLSRYESIHPWKVCFREWAEGFFDPLATEHLDTYLVERLVLADYQAVTGDIGMTSQRFRRRLGKWAAECDYIEALNPYDLCTVKPADGKQNGRILRRLRDADGNPTGSPVDFIYLRTDPEVYPHTKAECEAEERNL